MGKVGRHESFSSIQVTGFQDAIFDILEEYGETVYQATEEGLTAAEKVLISELKSATPKKTGNFRKNWKGTGKKYKLSRFVGNTTTVEGKDGEKIALANIFEYSLTRGKPFIKVTWEDSIEKMAAAAVAEIRKGV